MQVLHKDGLFFIGSEERPQAYLKYTISDENEISINSTFVDPKLRGQGVAKILTEKVADLAQEKGYKVIPVCSYAVKFFDQEQYKHLLG